MSVAAKHDYEEIRRNREAGVEWSELAAALGVKSSTLRSRYYRWLETEQGKRAPGYEPPPPAFVGGDHLVLTSRTNNTFLIGIAGDRHHGSKYHRNDVLRDLHERFTVAGVDAVIDTGNWIDGESKLNRYDLERIGLTQQVHLMAEQTPNIGVPTYAIWGECHEGWYASREGMDVGEYAEMIMRRAGHDWNNLGYVEAYVVLTNAHSGKSCVMSIMHPGGGSAYAISYRPQKIVEALEGGEKPAVIIMGHYHKLETLNIRNVWVLQAGTCCDQTPWMRKKSIDAHLGGVTLEMEQDPDTGAIIGFAPKLHRYFNQGFYSGRWSKAGTVSKPPRA